MNNYAADTLHDTYLRSVIDLIEPDICVGIEIKSGNTWVENFRDNVLNKIGNGTYAIGNYVYGGSNNNAIYYRSDKFTFVSTTKLIGGNGSPKTYEFILTHTSTAKQIIIFGVHAPAGSDAERLTHVNVIRDITDSYASGVYFMAAGDFNFADATENSFNALVDDASSGYFIDPEGYDGTSSWSGNTLLFTSNTDDLDRRRDLILNSQSFVNSEGIEYVTDSFTIPGNTDGTTAGIPQVYKDASDHLPVYADYLFYENPTPVELSSFTGVFNGDNIDLYWKTETEINNYGFNIKRYSSKSPPIWETIGFVEGHGNSNSPKFYTFTDFDIHNSGNYNYRLKQIDNDGTYKYYHGVSIQVEMPNIFYLSQNYPNPFNPETRIDYTVPAKQMVTLNVYNVLGELVSELVNEIKEAGSYTVTFDASSTVARLPSGIYIYRLKSPGYSVNKKMTLLK